MPKPRTEDLSALASEHERGYRIEPHAHAEAQLIYARAGVMRVTAAGGQWVLPPLRALWMPPGEVHAIDCRTAISLRTLYFAQPTAGIVLGCRVLAVSELLRAAVLRLVEGPLQPGQARLLAELVAAELVVMPSEPLRVPRPHDPRLIRIAAAWREDPADARGLSQWADLLGMSERSLMRLVVRDCGTTFRQWQRLVRLLAAVEWLAEGRSVTTVALDCGYASVSAFIQGFRLVFGVTPARYFRDPARRG